MGLHAVQFGNNWMRKIPRTAKLDKAIGRVQFGSQRNFSNSIISKLDSMQSYYVLIILFMRIKLGQHENSWNWWSHKNTVRTANFFKMNVQRGLHYRQTVWLVFFSILSSNFSIEFATSSSSTRISSKTLSSPRACRQSLKTLNHVDVLYLVFVFWYPSFVFCPNPPLISRKTCWFRLLQRNTKISSNMPQETSNSHAML